MMTMSSKMTDSDSKLTRKELMQIFWRSCMLDSSWNYERQQNIGYSFAMTPIVKKLYKDGSPEQARAYARGLDFMAVTPQISTLLMGINAAMEEENANNSDFDESSIAAVKASLMGPLAGIGDSLIAGTLRIIATGIAIGFSQQGSLLGPIMLLLIFNVPGFLLRFFGLKFGYRYGASFIKNAASGGMMEKVTFAASVVGLMAIGGMVASYVSLDLPFVVGVGEFAQPLTGYFDMIMPCLVQLALFWFMYWLLGRKNVKTVWVLVATIVVCIGCCFIGSLL